MAFRYSTRSKTKLSTTHNLIQIIFNEAINHMDISILEGYRNEEDQNKAFESGNSQVKFPNSKHNSYPSMAIDAVPYPIDWNNIPRLTLFAGKILGIASLILKHGEYELISGIDWNNDGNTKDHSFLDYPHFELRKRK